MRLNEYITYTLINFIGDNIFLKSYFRDYGKKKGGGGGLQLFSIKTVRLPHIQHGQF